MGIDKLMGNEGAKRLIKNQLNINTIGGNEMTEQEKTIAMIFDKSVEALGIMT